jgi:hypothetical protein
MREMRIVGKDRVQMDRVSTSKATVNTCCRLVENAVVVREGKVTRSKGQEQEYKKSFLRGKMERPGEGRN